LLLLLLVVVVADDDDGDDEMGEIVPFVDRYGGRKSVTVLFHLAGKTKTRKKERKKWPSDSRPNVKPPRNRTPIDNGSSSRAANVGTLC
jgi:hypothetical protein